jgi:hypothetical protein
MKNKPRGPHLSDLFWDIYWGLGKGVCTEFYSFWKERPRLINVNQKTIVADRNDMAVAMVEILNTGNV